MTFEELLALFPEEERLTVERIAQRASTAARKGTPDALARAAERIVERLRWHFRAARRPLPDVHAVEAMLAAYLEG